MAVLLYLRVAKLGKAASPRSSKDIVSCYREVLAKAVGREGNAIVAAREAEEEAEAAGGGFFLAMG